MSEYESPDQKSSLSFMKCRPQCRQNTWHNLRSDQIMRSPRNHPLLPRSQIAVLVHQFSSTTFNTEIWNNQVIIQQAPISVNCKMGNTFNCSKSESINTMMTLKWMLVVFMLNYWYSITLGSIFFHIKISWSSDIIY